MSEISFEEYVKFLIKEGYISEDFVPLKCTNCGSKEFVKYDLYYEDYWLVEYSVRCKICKTYQATWAYGTWFI